jgi:hypothetical protein
LADVNNDLKRVTREHLEQFGSAGLRTLCLAYRDLSPAMYESWNEKFMQAKSSLRDREKKLDEVYPSRDMFDNPPDFDSIYLLKLDFLCLLIFFNAKINYFMNDVLMFCF